MYLAGIVFICYQEKCDIYLKKQLKLVKHTGSKTSANAYVYCSRSLQTSFVGHYEEKGYLVDPGKLVLSFIFTQFINTSIIKITESNIVKAHTTETVVEQMYLFNLCERNIYFNK